MLLTAGYQGGELRRVAVLCVTVGVAALALGRAGAAYATNGFQPADGATTSNQPTFQVEIDPSDFGVTSLYVSTDTQMSGSYYPAHGIGSCTGALFGDFKSTGVANYYSCTPSSYSSTSYSSKLAPGTYYWWLTWYHADFSLPVSSWYHISGPFKFTVPQPVAPSNTYLVSPSDEAAVTLPPTFTISAPAAATVHIYVSLGSSQLSDGSPAGLTVYSCGGATSNAGQYYCTDTSTAYYQPGETFYWWAVIDVSGTNWIYGPRSFTIANVTSGGSGGSTGSGTGGCSGCSGGAGSSANNGPHTIEDAPLLPASAHFSGKSVKQTRLSSASYKLTKLLGAPKSIAVACWNAIDWPGISGDSGDGYYTTYGLYDPLLPHWINLSPTVCRGIETLLYHPPRVPNTILATDVDTVTHEMVHALGYTSEAQTECYAMQLSIVMAYELGVPPGYSSELARLTLGNYLLHPPQYIDTFRCREGGAWDLFPGHPSPPWHDYKG